LKKRAHFRQNFFHKANEPQRKLGLSNETQPLRLSSKNRHSETKSFSRIRINLISDSRF
jgi:hypothetical protein